MKQHCGLVLDVPSARQAEPSAAYDLVKSCGRSGVETVRPSALPFISPPDCWGVLFNVVYTEDQAARIEKKELLRELQLAREVESAMKAEAEVHDIQLQALLIVKHALATEVW